MPGSTLSVLSQPDDFQAIMKEDGCVDLLVTGQGEFRVRLSLIALHRMRMAAGEERQSRVAFVSVPSRFVRVTLPMRPEASLLCSGTVIQPDQIVTHSGGHRFHERTNGPSHWATMSVLTHDLVTSGRTMNGSSFALPPGECRWQPAPDVLRCLTSLHRNAVAATAACPMLPVDDEAAHGLEQQLLTALIECLVGEPAGQGNAATRRSARIMTLFEDMILASPGSMPPLADVRSMLGISEYTLGTYCHAHLGVSPGRYLYLHRMRLARRAQQDADQTETSVAK